MNESNGPVLADLFVFASASGSTGAWLATAALPAALIALGNQFVQVIVSIVECVRVIPNLWRSHGVFLLAEESSVLRPARVPLPR